MRHSHYAGWVALGAVIVAADYYGERTMSDGFRTLSRTRFGRPVTVTTWTVLTLHLFGFLPPRLDPFCRMPARHRPVGIADLVSRHTSTLNLTFLPLFWFSTGILADFR
jgi:hypothetical protein